MCGPEVPGVPLRNTCSLGQIQCRGCGLWAEVRCELIVRTQYNSVRMAHTKTGKTSAKKNDSKKVDALQPLTATPAPGPVTLCIDIGGSGLKAMLVDSKGKPVSERVR